MANQQFLTDLVLNISANSAEMKKGIDQANQHISGFKQGLASVGKVVAGAFAVGSIIAAGKAIFNFSQEISGAVNAVQSLSGVMGKSLTDSTAKALAISKTFGKDFNSVLLSAQALSKNLGISFESALEKVEKGVAAAGFQSDELLEILREYPSSLSEAGISADQFVTIASQSLKSGTFSDKGIDAIKEFGLRIRELTPATDEALQKIGLSGFEIQKQLANGTLTTFEALQQVSTKLNEFKGDSQEVGQALADIFSSAGEDAGLKFIQSLATINTDLDVMVENLTDAEKAQLHLSQATTELNKNFTQLFQGSGAGWTEIKAQAIDFAASALKNIRKYVIEIINFFIELYNESVAFRFSVQYVVFYFKSAIDLVKLLGKNIFDVFSSAGELIRAVFTGNFQEVPTIYKNAIAKVLENTVEFGQEIAADFKDGMESVLHNKPIKLINDEEVVSQAKNISELLSSNIRVVTTGIGANKQQAPGQKSVGTISNVSGQAEFQPLIDMTALGEKIKEVNLEIQNQNSIWTNMGDTVVGVVGDVSNAFGDMFTQQQGGWRSLLKTILQAISKIITALLYQAIAAQYASNSSSGFVGIAIATAAAGVLGAIFNGLINKIKGFEHGGLGSGTFLVGESGPELMSIGNNVARVHNNTKTRSILSPSTGDRQLVARIAGRDLEFILMEQQRTRLNST